MAEEEAEKMIIKLFVSTIIIFALFGMWLGLSAYENMMITLGFSAILLITWGIITTTKTKN